ncbi:hypothetical protein D9M69_576760 [compost metagenome]
MLRQHEQPGLDIGLAHAPQHPSQHLPVVQFGSDAAEVAAHLQAGDVCAFADHSHGYDPAAVAVPELIDHLLGIWGSVGHDPATFSPGF